MTLPATFHQLAWVVDDLDAAQAHWSEVGGVRRFMRMDGVRADAIGATHLGEPATWVIDLALGYHGDLQIELIRSVEGPSLYEGHSGPHHIGYLVDDIAPAEAELHARGYRSVQTVDMGGLAAVYVDTRSDTGLYTEIIRLDDDMAGLFETIRRGGRA